MHEIDRRTLLAMLGGSVALAACSGGSSPSAARASDSGSGQSPARPGTTVQVGGAPVGAADRFDAHDVDLASSHYAGTWLGAWTDEKGGNGNADVTIAVDTSARTLVVTLAVTGSLFGAPPPANTTYDVNIDSFSATADALQFDSPQFGSVAVDPSAFSLTFTDVPGHADVDTITVRSSVQAAAATSAITVVGKDGTRTRTAFAWAKGSNRPGTPSIGATSARTDFIQGVYAAELITKAELTSAFGRDAKASVPNGGRQEAQPGIDTSNGRADSVDGQVFAQWTVFRTADTPSAQSYFSLDAGQADPVAGLGDEAHILSSGLATLRVRKGNEVLEIDFNDLAGVLSVDQRRATEQQLAAAMVPRMTGS